MRIQRGEESFNTKKLGVIGAELAVLSGFFDPSWNLLVAGLGEGQKAWVLNEAGYDLQVLGRLKEAEQPIKAGVEAVIAHENWKNVAICLLIK